MSVTPVTPDLRTAWVEFHLVACNAWKAVILWGAGVGVEGHVVRYTGCTLFENCMSIVLLFFAE